MAKEAGAGLRTCLRAELTDLAARRWKSRHWGVVDCPPKGRPDATVGRGIGHDGGVQLRRRTDQSFSRHAQQPHPAHQTMAWRAVDRRRVYANRCEETCEKGSGGATGKCGCSVLALQRHPAQESATALPGGTDTQLHRKARIQVWAAALSAVAPNQSQATIIHRRANG